MQRMRRNVGVQCARMRGHQTKDLKTREIFQVVHKQVMFFDSDSQFNDDLLSFRLELGA